MPDARPGQTLTTADSTADGMPDSARQTVTVRVIAETLQDGALTESTVLSSTLDASIAADQQVLVTFAPDTGGGGGLLGGGPGGVLGGGGGEAYIPILTIDGGTWSGDPVSISASTGGGGLLGGGGGTQDLASLSLEVESDGPGLDPEIARHLIVDRVPAALRDGRSLTPDDLLPVPATDGTPAMFATVLHVMLSTGGSSPRAYAWQQAVAAQTTAVDANQPTQTDAGLAVTYAPVGVADETLVIASEQRTIPAIDDAQVRAFVARPRVYISSWSEDTGDSSRVVALTDLAIDHVRTLPHADAPSDAAARHQLWYGALQAALETEHALDGAVAFDPGTLTMAGVSLGMTQPLTVLTGDDAAALPSGTAPGLVAALAAGSTVVVPGDPGVASSWWQIAADGGTRSILAPTFGGVGGIGGAGRGGGGPKITPIDPTPRQPGQQRRPDPKPVDEWEKDDEAGDEYGTVVNEVATKTEQVAEPGSDALKALIEKARLGLKIGVDRRAFLFRRSVPAGHGSTGRDDRPSTLPVPSGSPGTGGHGAQTVARPVSPSHAHRDVAPMLRMSGQQPINGRLPFGADRARRPNLAAVNPVRSERERSIRSAGDALGQAGCLRRGRRRGWPPAVHPGRPGVPVGGHLDPARRRGRVG